MKIAICDVEGRTTKGIKQNLCVMYSIAMESPQGFPHYTKEDLHIMKRSINFLRKCFVFWTIMFAVFFHDIFLPRSVYLIILYNVLAGQDCNLVFFKSSIDFITHLLCLLLSSTCLHVSFLFNLSHTGFSMVWFAYLFCCIFVLGC